MAAFAGALAPGSYVVVSVGSGDEEVGGALILGGCVMTDPYGLWRAGQPRYSAGMQPASRRPFGVPEASRLGGTGLACA